MPCLSAAWNVGGFAQARRQFAFNKQAVIIFFGFDPLADGHIPLVAVEHLWLAVIA